MSPHGAAGRSDRKTWAVAYPRPFCASTDGRYGDQSQPGPALLSVPGVDQASPMASRATYLASLRKPFGIAPWTRHRFVGGTTGNRPPSAPGRGGRCGLDLAWRFTQFHLFPAVRGLDLPAGVDSRSPRPLSASAIVSPGRWRSILGVELEWLSAALRRSLLPPRRPVKLQTSRPPNPGNGCKQLFALYEAEKPAIWRRRACRRRPSITLLQCSSHFQPASRPLGVISVRAHCTIARSVHLARQGGRRVGWRSAPAPSPC